MPAFVLVGVLFVLVIVLGSVMSSEGDGDSGGGPAATQGDPSTFSATTCADAWDQLDPVTADGLGPRSNFIEMCTGPGARDLMCGFDPTIPECRP